MRRGVDMSFGHVSWFLGHVEPQDKLLLETEDSFYVVKPFPDPDLDPVGQNPEKNGAVFECTPFLRPTHTSSLLC